MSDVFGIGAGVGAVAGLVGGYFQNQANEKAQKAAIAADFQLQANNQQWQQMMASTAYQRTVSDLKASGLNPMLAYMNGAGQATSAPSGGMTSAPTGAPRANLGQAAIQSASQAADALNSWRLGTANVAKTQQDTLTSAAQAAKATADAHLSNTQAAESAARTGKLIPAQVAQLGSSAKAAQASANAANASAALTGWETNYARTYNIKPGTNADFAASIAIANALQRALGGGGDSKPQYPQPGPSSARDPRGPGLNFPAGQPGYPQPGVVVTP